MRAVAAPLQPGQLGSEQLVVGDRGLSCQRGLAGAEQLGTGEQLAYLVEDEVVELVGVDAPFGATAVLPTGTHRVVVRARVIAGHPVVAVGPVGSQLDPAVATAHEPP